MSFTRRSRYFYWILKDLSVKHTRSLLFGFIIGFVLSVSYWRLAPLITKTWFTQAERIGVVGDFQPENLPLSIQNQISYGLTILTDDGLPLPGLASSWESTDSGRRYIFHLKKGILWHNGKQFTSADVNYNIKNVTIVPRNDYTVEAKLENPYSPFPVLVSKPLFKSGLIGVGPYRISKIRIKGNTVESINLIPQLPENNLRPKEYRFYRTESLAILAFKLGEIDTLQDISNPKELADWGNNKIYERVRYDRIVALFFNMKDPLMGEKSFRQALGYDLPVFPQERAYSPISVKSWAYSNNVKKYDYDVKQAEKLLDTAKVATESPALTITTLPNYLDDAQTIANSWQALGIKTDIKVTNAVPDTYEVLLTAVDLSPDPDQYLLWHSTQDNTNVTYYANVKIDKLLEDGRQEFDPEKRKTIYSDFARRLVDDAPALFLYYPKTYTISRR